MKANSIFLTNILKNLYTIKKHCSKTLRFWTINQRRVEFFGFFWCVRENSMNFLFLSLFSAFCPKPCKFIEPWKVIPFFRFVEFFPFHPGYSSELWRFHLGTYVSMYSDILKNWCFSHIHLYLNHACIFRKEYSKITNCRMRWQWCIQTPNPPPRPPKIFEKGALTSQPLEKWKFYFGGFCLNSLEIAIFQ